MEPRIKQHLFYQKVCSLQCTVKWQCSLNYQSKPTWSFHYGAAVKTIRCRFSLHNFWSIHCYWPAVLVSTASYHRAIPEDSEWYLRWITIYHTKMLVDLLHSHNFLPIHKLQMLIKRTSCHAVQNWFNQMHIKYSASYVCVCVCVCVCVSLGSPHTAHSIGPNILSMLR